MENDSQWQTNKQSLGELEYNTADSDLEYRRRVHAFSPGNRVHGWKTIGPASTKEDAKRAIKAINRPTGDASIIFFFR